MLFTTRDLLKLIIPIVLENFLSVLVGTADSMMVSAAGEEAVSAVSLVGSINILLVIIFSSLASGGTVVVSQYLGKRDEKMAKYSSKQLVLIIFLVSSALAAVTIVFRKSILSALYGNVDPLILDYSSTYLLISALSFPFLALYNASSAIFRSIGRSTVSLVCGVVMNILNVLFNALFIYSFQMGVAGAAWATFIGRVVACLIMMILLANPEIPIGVTNYLDWHFDFDIIGKILKIAVPSACENCSFQFGRLLLARLVASYGTASISAQAIAASLSEFQNIPGTAVSVAILTVFGRCVGAQEYDQARYYLKKMILISYAVVASLGVFLFFTLDSILDLYNVSQEAKALAKTCTTIHLIGSSFFHPMAYCFPNCLRASNDARYTMIVSAVSMFTLRVGMSYLLAHFIFHSVVAVYVANIFDWISRTFFFVLRYRSGKWMEKKLI